jgi:hypothetical protein
MLYDNNTKEVMYSSQPSLNNKTFVINHPVDKNKYLVHACLEGPEAGVYYRGIGKIDNKQTEIKLPKYVCDIATEFTVNLTPKDEPTILSASSVENNKFTVKSLDPCEFYWTVYGKRAHIDVEPYKENKKLMGYGPYTYLA